MTNLYSYRAYTLIYVLFAFFFSLSLVRSIASVSLRKSRKTPFHFDFFTISFNKDYSALYGGKNNTDNIDLHLY